MSSQNLIFTLAALLLVPSLGRAEEVTVVTANGARLAVIADFPAGEGRHPAIVLAPGQGYHMNLPALEESARSLVANGVAVFRFNWAYFTAQPKGEPSNDLSKELQDFQAVLAVARRHPRVAKESVSVGGKSLGSVVAWSAFAADSSLRSGLFLTPICSRVPKGETLPRSEARENYPGFETERRPTLFIAGNRDPLCSAQVLYRHAGAGTGSARVAVVGGDHSYEDRSLTSLAAEVSRTRNIAAVAALATGFVAEVSSGNE